MYVNGDLRSLIYVFFSELEIVNFVQIADEDQ